jgi:hypothetical protein
VNRSITRSSGISGTRSSGISGTRSSGVSGTRSSGVSGASRWSSGPNPLGLTDLQVATGVVCDTDRHGPDVRPVDRHPLVALEAVLRPLLERPPVVVAFSGGRDSSALLATAVRLARAEGLPLPVALTAFWTGDTDSDEHDWQETVVRSLGIADWERFDPGTDLDLLGPVARDALRRHGLFWPAPAYSLIPMIQRARGGTLVSGEGGDQLFGWWPLASLRSAVADHRKPSRSEVRHLLLHLSPYRFRYQMARRSVRPYQTWLQPGAVEAQRIELAAERAAEPWSWKTYVAQQAASSTLRLMLRTMQSFGAAEGAVFAAPLLEARFVAALGRFGGHTGIGDRSAVMTAVFDGLLPRPVLTRVSKATFGRVFWGPESREFARQWSGHGLPADLVNVDAMHQAWLAERPVYGSALPLQAAWLATQVESANTPRGVDPVGNQVAPLYSDLNSTEGVYS